MAEYVNGDLLESDCYYIVHQTNCLTVDDHGLSKTMNTKYPHGNVYAKRTRIGKRNLATIETRSRPGHIDILEGVPNIVCMYGQWRPGSLYSKWFKIYPEYSQPETKENRLLWFRKCLKRFGLYILENGQKVKVGFPYRIGCGLAGGCWDDYKNSSYGTN